MALGCLFFCQGEKEVDPLFQHNIVKGAVCHMKTVLKGYPGASESDGASGKNIREWRYFNGDEKMVAGDSNSRSCSY